MAGEVGAVGAAVVAAALEVLVLVEGDLGGGGEGGRLMLMLGLAELA